MCINNKSNKTDDCICLQNVEPRAVVNSVEGTVYLNRRNDRNKIW